MGSRSAVEAWGRGYATQLGLAALEHAFKPLGPPEVYRLVRPGHGASIRVLEKIGVRLCGELNDVSDQPPSRVFKAQRDAPS
ncbi:GNAT family N-acetyltransferase [Pseudomonas sp. KCJK8993]|uniref:GNAT family N-acetyltransferase n=1 Tax=Pseudomonas sp. KCJK8993 TaxID=3344565 RepID=UPI003905D787